METPFDTGQNYIIWNQWFPARTGSGVPEFRGSEVQGTCRKPHPLLNMALFKKGLSPHQTALAMIGAKAGSSVLVIGASDLDLTGEVAVVTGLNGRTLVVDPDPGVAAKAEEAGGKAGGLIEFQRAPLALLPIDPDTFDVVVLPGLAAQPPADRAPVVAEAFRVARPGGRVVIVAREKRAGVFGAFGSTPTLEAAGATARLNNVGARAGRDRG
jgi:SAM-dependent methyltransferase